MNYRVTPNHIIVCQYYWNEIYAASCYVLLLFQGIPTYKRRIKGLFNVTLC